MARRVRSARRPMTASDPPLGERTTGHCEPAPRDLSARAAEQVFDGLNYSG
jgi:hypothetical protein